MNQLPHFYWLLEVEAVPRFFQHENVFTPEIGEGIVVKLDVVEDLPLERLGAVKHKTGPLEGLP